MTRDFTKVGEAAKYKEYVVTTAGKVHEPITRCKDCRHYVPFMNECDYPDGNGDYLRIITPPEHFCSWGERR